MSNSDKIILDLCGGTGSWSEPYKRAGYDVRLITLPYYDVLNYQPPKNVYGVLAAPPCTHFSLACNRLWNEKDKNGITDKALEIVNACINIAMTCKPKFWALENPKGRLHKFIGQPLFKFGAYEFGSPFWKSTWLWGDFNTFIIKGPVNENPQLLEKANSAELFQLPGDYNLDIDHSKRAAQRSILPPQFCKAFFDANQ